MKTSRETFAGRRRAPDLFGLDRAALYPTAAAWTAGAMALTILRTRLGLSWPAATTIALLPAVIVTLAALYLIHGKPRGYLSDWLEEWVLGRRNLDDVTRSPKHPHHAP